MRDPNRIDAVLQALGTLWKECPDLRLCQLIVNVAGKNDPFYVEDDVFANRLIEFAAFMEKAERARMSTEENKNNETSGGYDPVR